jgi:hypothetical protein
MIVLITLTTAGSDTGPFNLYSNVDGFTNVITSGISKAALLSGYTATVPDGTTYVLLKSTGACKRDLYLDVSGAPTPITTTTTSTTTIIPPPPTSTLTFENYEGGYFIFTLTNALSVPVTITTANVDGSHVNNCGPYEESDDIAGNPITIPAGMNYGSGPGNSPMTCSVNSWKRRSPIVVSGVGVLTNGQTVNIGGTIVTVIINGACENNYAC